jgi:hypothetical protein
MNFIKQFLKPIEEHWHDFTENEKNAIFEKLEEFEEKLVRLSGGQRSCFDTLFDMGSVNTKDIQVFDLLSDIFSFEKRIKGRLNMKEERGLKKEGTSAVKGTEIVECEDVATMKITTEKVKPRLVVRQEMPVSEWVEVVKALHASGFFPDLRSVGQAIAKAQAGREMGLQPYYSLQHLYILPGKPPALDAQCMGMLIKKAGYDYRVVKSDATICTLKFYGLKGEELGDCAFTYAEASRITQGGKRLVDKEVWRNYPADMLFSRCLSRGYRRFTPHLGVVYLREELDIEENEQVSGSTDLSAFKVADITPATMILVEPAKPTREDILKALVDKHGKAKVTEVKIKNKIEGKLLEISDEDFKKITDTFEALEKVEKKVKGNDKKDDKD